MANNHQYENLEKSEVSVGSVVVELYCGRPIGVAGRPIPKRTVVKVGRTNATLDDGSSVRLGKDEIRGIAMYASVSKSDK